METREAHRLRLFADNQRFPEDTLSQSANGGHGTDWGGEGGEPLSKEEILHAANYQFDIWAGGYNWLQSNRDSGAAIKEAVENVILAADATAWWTIGRDGQLLDLALPALPEHNEETLQIDNDCLAELLRAGEVDAMADYMAGNFPDLLAVRDGYANYEILDQTLRLCSGQCVFGTTDQYALGVAALFTDGRLLTAPETSTWLSEKTWGEKGIEDALAESMENKGFS